MQEALKAIGFDEAIIGQTRDIATSSTRIIYSVNKCIDILMANNNWEDEEAVEYFEFNISGAYVGPNTPIFLEEYIEE